MKRVGGSVLLVVLLLVVAIGGAAALAIGGVTMLQRSVGAHTEEGRALATQAREPAPSPRTRPGNDASAGSARPTRSAAERQEWANEQVSQWVGSRGAATVNDLPEPHRHVQAWFAPSDGALHLLTTAGDLSGSQDLETIARDVMARVARLDADLAQVTVSTSDGTLSETIWR